jgi:hypothetical protein
MAGSVERWARPSAIDPKASNVAPTEAANARSVSFGLRVDEIEAELAALPGFARSAPAQFGSRATDCATGAIRWPRRARPAFDVRLLARARLLQGMELHRAAGAGTWYVAVVDRGFIRASKLANEG